MRALPPPALYQPPPPALLERKSSTRSSFSVAPASPTSVAAASGESASGGVTTSSSSRSNKSSATGKIKENTGRWQAEEHEVFLKGLNEHGKQWKKIAMMIKTRSVVQVRTHAQKYFQKLLKNEKKEEGRTGKERSSSILSTSTATSVAQTTPSGAVKRKSSSSKGNNKTTATPSAVKKRRVSLEPKPKKQPLPPRHAAPPAPAVPVALVHHHHLHHQQLHAPPPSSAQPLMATAPPMPMAPPAVSSAIDHNVIDPSFMNSLNMPGGELDDSILDLLDDSSVSAVEQGIIGSNDDLDMDLEPNKVEPNPVSPSVSSMSLADVGAVEPTPVTGVMAQQRHEMVTSPNPEDYAVLGTSTASPTSVACMMDMKDFEQKTSNYIDALDWLMDVGVHQLPATANEQEDWAQPSAGIAVPVVPKLSPSKLAQVNSSALSVLDGDVF